MYLKRMELMGFKSFPTKTKISFEPGISCIVGPNGSGKSNVADALRWVLGEQSTKMLRGGKLEDVIFSGSRNRRPLGMAEVSLILDNSDKTLPLEFAEVEVTRRNFRGGISEYLINNRSCRLKDIADLFVDTGIGADGLSLINQGRINELISVRPEERRALVEEAAGIVKYRNRKKEAARKLAETERHLERIGDIIGELAARIEPLRLQSAKAQKYLQLKQEADTLEISVSVKVLSEAGEKIAQLDKELAAENRLLEQFTTERYQQAAAAEQLRLELAGIDELVQTMSQEFYALQSQREKAEGLRNLAQSRKDNGAEKQRRLEAELAELSARAEQQKEQADALQEHVAKTTAEVAALEKQIVAGAGGEQERREAAALLTEQLAEKKDSAYQLAGLLAELRNHRSFQEQLLEKARQRQEKLTLQTAELQQGGEGRSQQLAEIFARLDQISESQRQLGQQVNQGELALRKAAQVTQELAEREAELKYQTATLTTKTTMLREMAQSYEGFYPGVRELLKAKGRGQAPEGIVDAVANLLEVPPQYRAAVEIYLGGALQNIVCRSAQSAKEAIAWLKKREAGRATFLPLDKLQVRNKADFAPARKLPGVFGCAAELVSCSADFDAAKNFLLNNMLLVDTMDTALKAAEAMRFRVSVVTLEGDVVNPGASMAGGSRRQKTGEMLGKKSKLQEAEQQLAEAKAEQEELSHKLAQSREESQAVSAQMDEIAVELRTLAQEATALRLSQEKLESEDASASRLGVSLTADQKGLTDEMAEAEEAIAELEQEYQQRQQENELVLTEIDQLQQQLNEKTASLDQSRAGVAKGREELAALRQKLRGQRLSLEKLERDNETIVWEQEEKAADCRQAEQELAEYSDDIGEKEQVLADLARELQESKDLLEQRQHGLAAETGRLAELEQKERQLQKQMEQSQNNLHQLELKKTRWEADWVNEEAKLTEKFQMSFAAAQQQAVLDQSRTAMSQNLAGLRKEIAAIGNVNVDAIEEFREVDERYTFLSGQHGDLVEAGSQLKAVIAEMDGIMSSRFRKAFQQLSGEFNSSFRRLFGGGEAALALTEPDNILETGVELVVSPPGKKINNYNLLSGGEKSMIGIALLFAMLAVRPTPFCLMDEVDAALDEANIQRFTSFLQEKADQSQFVMITHRQSTMEAASALWGLTMEEEGVSKIVSVKLNQTE